MARFIKFKLGLYRDFDITEYLIQPKFVRSEEVNGLYRYSLGWFRDYNMAKTFLDDVRKMGITDAFITEYDDGVRDIDPNSSASKVYGGNSNAATPTKTVQTPPPSNTNTNSLKPVTSTPSASSPVKTTTTQPVTNTSTPVDDGSNKGGSSTPDNSNNATDSNSTPASTGGNDISGDPEFEWVIETDENGNQRMVRKYKGDN